MSPDQTPAREAVLEQLRAEVLEQLRESFPDDRLVIDAKRVADLTGGRTALATRAQRLRDRAIAQLNREYPGVVAATRPFHAEEL